MVSRAIDVALPRVRTRTWAALHRLEAVPTWRVLATVVVLQWILVLGIAFFVRHAGWIYYQGGDQLWYYTTGWLLVHGHFPPLGVGYLWCILLAPIAAVMGPNVADAYPAIIVVQFLFLLPIAPLALYGIGRRIGGRLFGYWTAALWLVVPLVAIKYTDAGYHQRFTEVLLPQGFGLTAMADFPTMLAALVSGYFCIRILADEPRADFDALAGGVAAGIAIAIKPATALFLAGPALAFLVARRGRAATLFTAGVVPAALTLAFAKWRAIGEVPILHAAPARHVAAGSRLIVGSATSTYIPFHWHIFITQLDQIREHFWSARLVEWLVVAGALALCIRSRRYGALVIGWFAAIVVLKTGSGRADMEGGNLLRVLMPAYPAFVLLLASLPFLIPGVARRVVPARAHPQRVSSASWTVLVSALVASVLVPVAAYAATTPIRNTRTIPAAFLGQPPIPLDVDLHTSARSRGKVVRVAWRAQHAAGGPVFYHVFRRDAHGDLCFQATGAVPRGAYHCSLVLTDLGTTRAPTFVDRAPGGDANAYYVGVAANWLNDTSQGDVYVLGKPAVAARGG